MSGLRQSVRHNLGSLTRFSGRDDRSTFWPYAAVAFVAYLAIGWIALIPQVLGSMARMDRSFAQPAGPPPVAGDSLAVMADFRLFFFTVAAVALAFVVMLAAAVARRLHDRGMSGLWGLMPIPFVVFSFAGMIRLFSAFGGPGGFDMGLFMLIFLSNALYFVAVIFLIVQLALAGAKGPNRFGREPLA